MWNMTWPILLVLLSNVAYHISQKSVPAQANIFGSLMVTYLVSAGLAALLFLFSAKPQNLLSELGKLNWSAVVLGVVLVAVEAAWIFIYRVGWRVSVASLTANICLACLLVFVGALLYKEVISARQILGMAVCAVGLVLINL